ncbi:MAG TPA: hypothetical protein VFV93_06940 [Thermomicrobiales bacterium]|nr:hypothetical protein [Thermomicrobiales bacterium]
MTLTGRTAGIIMVVAGVLVGAVAVAWLASSLADDESGLRLSGAVFGGALLFIVLVLPLLAGGIFLYIRGGAEARQFANAERQRKMLGIVESAGEISIADLALQIQGTRDSVRSDLYDLVSKGLFAGYVDWDRGILFARQASELRGKENCPNCGGQLSLAGKGLVRCPYCGAEIFLP